MVKCVPDVIDVHSHILPALDDGVKTLAESIESLKGLSEIGFTHVVATPHFYPGLFTPSVADIDSTLVKVREALLAEAVPLALIRGRECFLDFQLTTAPERETFPFEWNGRRYLLIEISGSAALRAVSSYVRTLGPVGVTPILAHAERHGPIIDRPERIEDFRKMGFKIQIDLISFTDSASPQLRKTAFKLLESASIDLVASDLHSPSQLLSVREGADVLRKRLGEDGFRKLCALT
jgi:protein-tyrosine phosphatase